VPVSRTVAIITSILHAEDGAFMLKAAWLDLFIQCTRCD